MQFKSITNEANHLMHRAKCDYFTRIVNENSHNQSKLFSVAKNLLVPKSNQTIKIRIVSLMNFVNTLPQKLKQFVLNLMQIAP